MSKIGLALLCALAPVSAANAQNMPLSEYMSRTEAALRRGASNESAEYLRLRQELQGSLRRARNERRIARREGRAPRACLSPTEAATNTTELARHFETIPAEQRATISVGEAFMQLMERKFPCSPRRAGERG